MRAAFWIRPPGRSEGRPALTRRPDGDLRRAVEQAAHLGLSVGIAEGLLKTLHRLPGVHGQEFLRVLDIGEDAMAYAAERRVPRPQAGDHGVVGLHGGIRIGVLQSGANGGVERHRAVLLEWMSGSRSGNLE